MNTSKLIGMAVCYSLANGLLAIVRYMNTLLHQLSGGYSLVSYKTFLDNKVRRYVSIYF